MSIFAALPIAQSGIEVSQTWLDTLAGNIANANDVVATNQPVYQPESVVVAPAGTGPAPGVQVTQVALGSAAGTLAYDPSSPLADARGLVRESAVNLGQQLVELVMAQASYQANVAALSHARTAYESALQLGN